MFPPKIYLDFLLSLLTWIIHRHKGSKKQSTKSKNQCHFINSGKKTLLENYVFIK